MANLIANTAHSGMRWSVVLLGGQNVGKSSLMNKLLGQDVSIVSDTLGTTTDVVAKSYELDGVGAVTLYDTAGIDDDSELGNLRISATEKVLRAADVVLLIIGKDGLTEKVQDYFDKLVIRKVKFMPIFTFADERGLTSAEKMLMQKYNGVLVSSKTGLGIDEVKAKLSGLLKPLMSKEKRLADGLVKAGDYVILVTPQDVGAPKGRLIMPQVQMLRELLDMGVFATMCKQDNLTDLLAKLPFLPDLVITDSQVVKKVQEILPEAVKMTTFSILFARVKGDFRRQLEGTKVIDELQDGDKILIAEGCSHHISCEDIGRIKIPNWIIKYSGKKIDFHFSQGSDFPEDLSSFKLVIMCGGCILNKAEMQRRLQICTEHQVNVTNYGLAISKLQGVLDRAIAHVCPFEKMPDGSYLKLDEKELHQDGRFIFTTDMKKLLK